MKYSGFTRYQITEHLLISYLLKSMQICAENLAALFTFGVALFDSL